MKNLLFACLLVFVVAGAAFAQIDEANGDFKRRAVTVPSGQYPDIQSALNARECNIRILPGYYRVNLQVLYTQECVTTISADEPNTVLLDGGNTGNTISLWIDADVNLKNLNIANDQPIGNYEVGAVQGWGGTSFTIENCSIVSRGVGLSTTYAEYVTVINSTFVGTASDSVGIRTFLNNPLGRNTGVRLYNNFFSSMHIAVYHYELHDPSVQTISFCRTGRRCEDSNSYQGVQISYHYVNGSTVK